jgi:hypothetical protein
MPRQRRQQNYDRDLRTRYKIHKLVDLFEIR